MSQIENEYERFEQNYNLELEKKQKEKTKKKEYQKEDIENVIIQTKGMFEDSILKKKLGRAKEFRSKLMNEVGKLDHYMRELEKQQ